MTSPKTKLKTYSYFSKNQSPRSPPKSVKNTTFSQNQRMRNLKEKSKKLNDLTMNMEFEEVSGNAKPVSNAPRDLRRAKSTKRVERNLKGIGSKNTVFSPKNFRGDNMSPKGFAMKDNVTRVQQAEKQRKFLTQKSVANMAVKEYPYHGIGKMENFSKKLHAVSNTNDSKRSNPIQSDSCVDDPIREKMSSDAQSQYLTIDDGKDFLSTVSDFCKEKKSEKCHISRMKKSRSIYEDTSSKMNHSDYTSMTQMNQRKRSENVEFKTNKTRDGSRQSSQDQSAMSMKTEPKKLKARRGKLGSPITSPKINTKTKNICLPMKSGSRARKNAMNNQEKELLEAKDKEIKILKSKEVAY